jgi:hypothetical protein
MAFKSILLMGHIWVDKPIAVVGYGMNPNRDTLKFLVRFIGYQVKK